MFQQKTWYSPEYLVCWLKVNIIKLHAGIFEGIITVKYKQSKHEQAKIL